MVGSFRRFLKVFDFGLEVLEVVLLSLAESSLGCSILRLAFLNWSADMIRQIGNNIPSLVPQSVAFGLASWEF